MSLDDARALFPVLARIAYLNAGTFGPLATPVVAAMQRALERELEHGRSGKPVFDEVMEERALLRADLAALVDVDPELIALTTSTTNGCSIVLTGLDLDPADEVVTTTDEHFGLLGPLAASGARVVVVEPDAEAIVAAVTARTRLIAVSQVLWTTGAELPVAEIRESAGVPILVDGAQSVGAMPVRATGIDFLTVSGQKWLTGPDGTGALVIAEPDRLRVAAPTYFSQTAYAPNGTFEPRPGAARFDAGWMSAAVIAGLRTALALRPEWWYGRAREATDRCRRRIAERTAVVDAGGGGTLVSFKPARGTAAELVERLHRDGIHVREIPGRGLVRASIGWWTSDGDVDRLVAAV